MVRSSSAGSRTFPTYHSSKQHPHKNLRRQLSHFPLTLLHQIKQHSKLSRSYHRRHKLAILNAKGIMKEEELAFLGQGWFRSAWKMDVGGIPEYEEGEEEDFFDESVVLKTLR